MAVDMFIKLDGIKGESGDKSHKEEINVLAWSWGMCNSGSAHLGRRRRLGQGECAGSVAHEVHRQVVAGSHAVLLQRQALAKAQLTVRKAGENALEYLIIKLEDILITAVSTGGSGGEDRLTENVTLNFAKVDVEYTEQNAQGGAGAKPKMGWDIVANVKK